MLCMQLRREAEEALFRLCCSSNSPRVSLEQQLQQGDSEEDVEEQQQQQQLSPEEKRRQEKQRIRNLQQQWEEIQIVR